MELRILQIVGDEDEEEPEKLHPIELLLDYFIHETACRNNFDFVQAVIRVFLKVIDIISFYILPIFYIFFLSISHYFQSRN